MVYKWYILPIGGVYATYHLLGEPETTIDFLDTEKPLPSFTYKIMSLKLFFATNPGPTKLVIRWTGGRVKKRRHEKNTKSLDLLGNDAWKMWKNYHTWW